MQKHAFSSEERYKIIFCPIPFSEDGDVYCDPKPVGLPRGNDFPYLHCHDCYEVGVCESGEGLFLCEGEYFSVEQGDVILVPPGRRHYSRALHADSSCFCRFSYLRAAAVERALSCAGEEARKTALDISHRLPSVVHPADNPKAVSLLREITAFRGGTAVSFPLRLAAFLLEAEALFSVPKPLPNVRVSAEMRALAEYLSLHYNEDMDARQLSAMWHLSPSQLRRRFAEAYGQPPITFRNSLRIKVAAELLSHTELSVAAVAERVGYSAPSDLYRAFLSAYGVSPSVFKKQRKGV